LHTDEEQEYEAAGKHLNKRKWISFLWKKDAAYAAVARLTER
jgi:predicted DNA-binding protein (MmcQ/YjbR family)